MMVKQIGTRYGLTNNVEMKTDADATCAIKTITCIIVCAIVEHKFVEHKYC